MKGVALAHREQQARNGIENKKQQHEESGESVAAVKPSYGISYQQTSAASKSVSKKTMILWRKTKKAQINMKITVMCRGEQYGHGEIMAATASYLAIAANRTNKA